MTRSMTLLSLALLLSGCADFASSVTNTIDGMGMTPDYAKGLQDDLQPQKKLTTPVINVAETVPEGKLIEKYDNGGKKFETVVKNRCFNEYIDIYYPNGTLRTHTPLVNCKAEGLSQGYTQEGKLRTTITFKDSVANGEAKTYDANGKVLQTVMYNDGFPQKR